MFESIEVAITRILRIQKEAKGNPSCIYSRAKQRGLSRFARVRKGSDRVSGLGINHVPKSLGLIC